MEQDHRLHAKPQQRQNLTHKVRTIQINENSPARDLESAATSSTDDEYVYVMQAPSHIKQPTTTVWISQQPLDMLIDTGATVNLLDKNAHDRVKMMTKLEPTNKKILPYGKQHPLPLLGKLTTDVSAHGRTTEATFYVVQGNHGSLLSHTTASELGLIHVVCSADILQPTLSVADQLMLKYPNITKGIGKFKLSYTLMTLSNLSSSHIAVSLSTSERRWRKNCSSSRIKAS